MPLTDAEIRNLKPAPRIARHSDGGGLFLEVAPTGAKKFRLSYRFDGSQRTMLLGEYPALPLAEARYLREVAKRKLRDGADPRTGVVPKRAEPVPPAAPPAEVAHPEQSYARYQEDYLEKRQREGAAAATLAKLRLHAEVLRGAMGERAIDKVTAQDVIRACKHYEQCGRLNSAQAVRILASQVFRFAIAQGAAMYDPAAPVKDAIAKPRAKHHAAVTDPKRIGKLMAAIRAAPIRHPQVRVGLLLSAYLAPRNLQLREMRWAHLTKDAWTIPGEYMKMDRDHIVPLPRQAREVIEWVRPITGGQERVLHSFASHDGLLSENTFNKALDQLGFDKRAHRQHGFRTTFSTVLNENGWNWDWIEMQLAHVEENKVRGAYNRALYLEDRKRMMQWYADWLDQREAAWTTE